VPNGQVVCVDPAELHNSLSSMKNITHIKSLAENSRKEIEESAPSNGYGFSILSPKVPRESVSF
jgi:hypothetical protein